jgi:hypothetical protein
VAVEPERSLLASPAIVFVAREECDFTLKQVAEGRRSPACHTNGRAGSHGTIRTVSC